MIGLLILYVTVFDIDNVAIPTLICTLIMEFMLLATICIFSISKYRVPWSALGLWGRPGVQDGALSAAVLIAGICIQLVYISVLHASGVNTDRIDLYNFVEESAVVLLILTFLALIVAPIVEELFFRGFVYGGLASRYNARKGALVSALVFAAAHIDPLTFLPLFLLGLMYAWLYHRTKKLWAPVFAHFSNNAIALAVFLV